MIGLFLYLPPAGPAEAFLIQSFYVYFKFLNFKTPHSRHQNYTWMGTFQIKLLTAVIRHLDQNFLFVGTFPPIIANIKNILIQILKVQNLHFLNFLLSSLPRRCHPKPTWSKSNYQGISPTCRILISNSASK